MNPGNNSKTKTFLDLELALLRALPYPTLSLCEAECLANLQARAHWERSKGSRNDYFKTERRRKRKEAVELLKKKEVNPEPQSLTELFQKRMDRK